MDRLPDPLRKVPDMTDKAGPPAGWFPDPEMANTLRYWDGSAWTDHRAPATGASALGAPNKPTHRGSSGLSVSLLVLGLITLLGSGIAFLDYNSKQISYRASALADSMSLSACDVRNTERFFSGLSPIPCGPTQPSPALALGLAIAGVVLLFISFLTRRRQVG